jgi:hypothetical protein
MSDGTKTLYERLGGYNAIATVASDLLSRLRADPQLGRFWAHRGEDGVMREKQLLIDFLCAPHSSGGQVSQLFPHISGLFSKRQEMISCSCDRWRADPRESSHEDMHVGHSRSALRKDRYPSRRTALHSRSRKQRATS